MKTLLLVLGIFAFTSLHAVTLEQPKTAGTTTTVATSEQRAPVGESVNVGTPFESEPVQMPLSYHIAKILSVGLNVLGVGFLLRGVRKWCRASRVPQCGIPGRCCYDGALMNSGTWFFGAGAAIITVVQFFWSLLCIGA